MELNSGILHVTWKKPLIVWVTVGHGPGSPAHAVEPYRLGSATLQYKKIELRLYHNLWVVDFGKISA